jgi:hypothetical protein
MSLFLRTKDYIRLTAERNEIFFNQLDLAFEQAERMKEHPRYPSAGFKGLEDREKWIEKYWKRKDL